MGASIYWRPVKPGKSLSVGGRSAFVEALKLHQPIRMTAADIPFLRGLAAGNADFANAVDEIIEAIEKHDEIEVYAEY